MRSCKMSDVELLSKLESHPELRSRFESILQIAENPEGTLQEADATELRLIEEVRKLGQETMQSWAQKQDKASTALALAATGVRREGKKNSAGTVHLVK